jgi:hypothetical protein
VFVSLEQTLLLAYWDSNGVRGKRLELQEFLSENKVGICLLKEIPCGEPNPKFCELFATGLITGIWDVALLFFFSRAMKTFLCQYQVAKPKMEPTNIPP